MLYSKRNASSAKQDTIVFKPISDYDEVKHPSDLHTDEDYDFIDEDRDYEFPAAADPELTYSDVYSEIGPYNEVRINFYSYLLTVKMNRFRP